jgi:hypothetical protein
MPDTAGEVFMDEIAEWSDRLTEAAPRPEPLRPLVKEARWASTRLAAQLIADSHAFYAQWTELQGQAPYAVYHYTDAIGINNILESGHIWASDLLYLAGSRELDYARELVRQHVGQRWNGDDPLLREFCALADTALDPRMWPRSVFAACFCENGDALAQWRAYAGPRGGYAVGLRTALLGADSVRSPPAHLRRVIYDPERQSALIGGLLDRTLALLRDADGNRTEAIEIALEYLADHLAELVASFKQPAFREDQEWRLLMVADTAYPDEGLARVRFRTAGGHIVPYIPVAVVPAGGPASSPIAEVICGPLERADLSARAIQMLLKKRGVTGARVRPSNLALR